MTTEQSQSVLKLALPKGRMQDGVFSLLADAGIHVRTTVRGYRPSVSYPGIEAKILKPQNIVEMLHIGSRDIGFAGADWVAELNADLVELVDTGLDPVNLVAAAPISLLEDGKLPKQHIVIASEYRRLTADWIEKQGLDATFVRSYGATEVFPPEDADCIVDVAATGATLRSNNLQVVDRLTTSSTRLYAHPKALDDPNKKELCDRLVLLIRSVLEARQRVMVEVNVAAAELRNVIAVLPCMRQPTVSPLDGDEGYAVKAAVPRDLLPKVIPEIKAHGGTDVVVTPIRQIVP